jgi:hypothetical protein
LPRFHALYNAVVQAYRRSRGIRSRNHPVPDLAVEGDWLEAPFWGWQKGPVRRGRLFVRHRGDRLELRVGGDAWPSLPAPAPGREAETVAAWGDLEPHGFKVRSRALTTTLFARVFLADLFVHGIGGGKYDELTDELIRRFYGAEPPAFLVLSATLWLPLGAPPVADAECRRLARTLRDVHWNPQRHRDDGDPWWRGLAAEKAEWIERQPATHAERLQRFHALRELTDQLRLSLGSRKQELARELALCEVRRATRGLLRRRDYSFCLYPAAALRPFCTRFL